MEKKMPDETKDQQAETAIIPPEADAQVTTPDPGDVFDKERAMATITKLRETEKQAKKDAKELELLKAEKKQRDDAALSETERLQKQAKELADMNVKLAGDILRRDVIAETGLPATFTDRLKGATKEELLADAKELLETLPTLKTAPKLPPTNPGNAQTTETDAQKRDRLFGKQGNPFDMESIKANGGGVVWNNK
jgi:hypothetical protein